MDKVFWKACTKAAKSQLILKSMFFLGSRTRWQKYSELAEFHGLKLTRHAHLGRIRIMWDFFVFLKCNFNALTIIIFFFFFFPSFFFSISLLLQFIVIHNNQFYAVPAFNEKQERLGYDQFLACLEVCRWKENDPDSLIFGLIYIVF